MQKDTDFGFSEVSMDKLEEPVTNRKTRFKGSLDSLSSDDAEVILINFLLISITSSILEYN